MKCPICKAKTKVLDSRAWKDKDYVYRCRTCQMCGYKFVTHETFVRSTRLRLRKGGKHEA